MCLSVGGYLPPEEIKERFDSNCITPVRKHWPLSRVAAALHSLRSCLQGTEFMDNLAKCLRYYVADRLNNDPGWKNVTVREPLDAAVPSCLCR